MCTHRHRHRHHRFISTSQRYPINRRHQILTQDRETDDERGAKVRPIPIPSFLHLIPSSLHPIIPSSSHHHIKSTNTHLPHPLTLIHSLLSVVPHSYSPHPTLLLDVVSFVSSSPFPFFHFPFLLLPFLLRWLLQPVVLVDDVLVVQLKVLVVVDQLVVQTMRGC